MVVMPIAAVVYLVVALKGDKPKRSTSSTPVLPSSQFGRQVHHATSPPKPKPTTPPVPAQFAPGRAERKRQRGTVVPLHGGPPPDHGPDSVRSARNQ